jgi:type IV pilus assembly protein PilW
MRADTHRPIERQRGMSLAEIMIALTLSMLIMVGMGSLFIQSKRSYDQDEQIARMQEDARFALTELVRDISLAGFWATMLDGQNMTLDASLSLGTDCGPAGWAGADEWLYTVVPAVEQVDNATGAQAAAAFSCIDAAELQAGTDVFAIKKLQGVETEVADLTAGDVYLETNGTIGILFEHDPVPGTAAPVTYWEYLPMIYYVRNYSVSSGDGIPTLCRKTIITNPSPDITTECLAEGIEDFQVEFGVDTDGDGIANQYKPDPTPVEMSDVTAVRIYIMVRSTDPDFTYDNDKTYLLSNAPNYTPGDNYYRRTFTTTILMRNPANLNRLGS